MTGKQEQNQGVVVTPMRCPTCDGAAFALFRVDPDGPESAASPAIALRCERCGAVFAALGVRLDLRDAAVDVMSEVAPCGT